MSQISQQPMYVNDPTKSRALFNGSLFFGLVDEDPEVEANQKLVRAVQENGNLVNLTQPVPTNSGGNPTFQGSPVVLDVDGDYSFKALNNKSVEVFFIPQVDNPADGSAGFSGVVAIETITLTSGQLIVNLTNLGANESVPYLIPAGSSTDRGSLANPEDYTVTGSQQITLVSSFNTGDKIQFRQNDPTGQLVPVNEDAAALFVFDDVTAAQTAATNDNLSVGDSVTLNGNAAEGDGLGGDKYVVIVTAFANDDVNYIDLNGTLQLELRSNYYRFQNYSETIGTPGIAAGVLNVDLNDGSTQSIVLGENLSDVQFVNFNPDTDFSSTVSLRIIQDGTGSRSVSWPGNIIWPGGIAPTLTVAADAIDFFGFTTYDAGTTWLGATYGQNYS